MIEAKHVRYGIRSREILRGVDFRVEKGEFVGLTVWILIYQIMDFNDWYS